MGEIIRPNFGRKQEITPTKDVVPEKRENLFFQISNNAQERINKLLKAINDSKYIHHVKVTDGDIEIQRNTVKGWNDSEVTNFIENSANEIILQSKPALVMALFERLIGKI